MQLRLLIDAAPAYELVLSLLAYLQRPQHKTLDLGPAWAANVRKGLSPALNARLKGLTREDDLGLPLSLLVWLSRRHGGAPGFVDWLASLTAGDLYQLIQPYLLPEALARTGDLAAARDRCVAVLEAWDAEYFRSVDPAILTALAAEAAARRAAACTAPPLDTVESATVGMRLDDRPELQQVLLIPQYHCAPINMYSDVQGLLIIHYPIEMAPASPDAPPSMLLRQARALADASRLRFLRRLATAAYSFTDLVSLSGLAKSTVHHHLTILRSAGLLRVYPLPGGGVRYALRPGAPADLGRRLDAYLSDGTLSTDQGG